MGDGQRIEIRPSERKEIPTKSRSVILKLIRSPDDVLILETPYLRVIYDGELLKSKKPVSSYRETSRDCVEQTMEINVMMCLHPHLKSPPLTKLLLSPIELESLAHLSLNNSRYTKNNFALPRSPELRDQRLLSS